MRKAHPPKLAEKLLLLFLRNELAEEVLGDLDEKFYSTLAKKSAGRARRNYWYQVFNYLRPFALKFFRSNSIFTTMIKHNFLISYRILLKNKAFSALNIGGLAIGMTVAILIGLWIHDELTFNKNHDNYDRIVQVLRKDTDGGNIYVNSSLVGQAGVIIAESYPTLFEKVAMTFFRPRPQLLTVGKQSFDRIGYFFQPDAPEMLSLKMVSGSRDGLKDRGGILLSESLARTFFGDQNPIGETVNINTARDLLVTGVYKDLPVNSTFHEASFLASIELIYNETNPYVWDNYNIRIYAQLREGVDINNASAAIKDLLMPHRDHEDGRIELFLIPMKDWHLHSAFENGVPVTSARLQYVRLYGIIGVFVLLLACINFMNLNTARYQNRAREVGIRKSVGSHRSQLINQFLAESFLYAFASFVLSLLVVYMVLPWFNGISDKALVIPWTNLWFWSAGVLFVLFSALTAGSYPAVFLSSFGPVRALKGTLKQGISAIRLRQALVVFQFTISIALIIGTIVVYNQLEHAKTRPVGYDQEGLITVRGRSEAFYESYHLLRDELKKTGLVTEIAEANYPLMNTLGNNNGFRMQKTGERINFTFNTIFVTHEYGKAVGWELIAGRDFSRELADESANIIISESALAGMGVEDAIGEVIQAGREFNGHTNLTVIGVVKDMIKGSPFGPPKPLMLFATKESMPFLFIRIKPGAEYVKALPEIQEAFERVLPAHPFNYEFVDNEYLTKFRSEERTGSLAALFSLLAILISCLGLFGLSAFMAEQRTKEIGIRKVLGASVTNLWKLLSKDFSILVVIACALAIPVAGYFMNQWLENYQYRIDLEWWIYAIAGVSALLITLFTVSFHSLKASYANPVDSLRSE